MARTVLARQLNVGDTIYVSGKVVYSHITKKIEVGSPEFEAANQRKINSGAEPATAAYSSITISHPSIKTKNPEAFKYVNDEIVADTSKMTPLEVYAYESMYKQQASGEWRLSNENKGNLPQVGQMNTATKEVTLITPKGELAVGLEVVLIFKVYQTKTKRKGLGLQAVFSLGDIRYYSANDTVSALADLGFVVKDQREAEPIVQEQATSTQPEQAPQQQNVVDFDAAAEAITSTDAIGAEDGGDQLPWS